jgi:hypothetical protein
MKGASASAPAPAKGKGAKGKTAKAAKAPKGDGSDDEVLPELISDGDGGGAQTPRTPSRCDALSLLLRSAPLRFALSFRCVCYAVLHCAAPCADAARVRCCSFLSADGSDSDIPPLAGAGGRGGGSPEYGSDDSGDEYGGGGGGGGYDEGFMPTCLKCRRPNCNGRCGGPEDEARAAREREAARRRAARNAERAKAAAAEEKRKVRHNDGCASRLVSRNIAHHAHALSVTSPRLTHAPHTSLARFRAHAQEQAAERRRLDREAAKAARAAGGPAAAVQTAEDLAREAQALREADMEALRASRGLATAAPDAAAPLPLLDTAGRPRLCATCRRMFDADAEYREFRCTLGCHIFMHPGACSREFERRYANENGGAKMSWVAGMKCLTALGDAEACDGTGLMCRNAGGSRYVLFDVKVEKGKGGKGGKGGGDAEKEKEKAAAPQQPQQQRGKSKAEKAAERAAAAAADAAAAAAAVAANAAAAEKAAAAAAEKAAADKAAADKAAAAAAADKAAAGAGSTNAEKAAAEKAAAESGTRRERRAPLQRQVPAPPDPGRTPSAAGIDPSELLNRSGPVKIISRKAEEEAEAEAAAAAAARRASAKDKGKAPAADADAAAAAAAAAAKSKKFKGCAHGPLCALCAALAFLFVPMRPMTFLSDRVSVCCLRFPVQRGASDRHHVRQRRRARHLPRARAGAGARR